MPDTVVWTVVLTDLRDSTKLLERLGDKAATRITRRHDKIARSLIASHNGKEIDRTDGFLVKFEHPLDAVRFALEFHDQLALLSDETGQEVASRIGVHHGELLVRENPPEAVARGAKKLQPDGIALSVVARVMSVALARQTLMTKEAFDAARRAATGELALPEDVVWLAHGPYFFKGMRESVDLYEVGARDFAPLKAPEASDKVIPAHADPLSESTPMWFPPLAQSREASSSELRSPVVESAERQRLRQRLARAQALRWAVLAGIVFILGLLLGRLLRS